MCEELRSAQALSDTLRDEFIALIREYVQIYQGIRAATQEGLDESPTH